MRKLRSNSTFSRLTAGQQEQVLNWLFNEGMGYAEAAERARKEFGLEVSEASVGRFYRRVAEERTIGELALAGGSVEDYRRATRKLLGATALRVCMRNYESTDGEGVKDVVAVMKLMLKDQEQEMKEQWYATELQRLKTIRK